MTEALAATGPTSAPPANAIPAAIQPSDLSWTVVQMRVCERIVINEALIAAYQAASSPHSVRALKSDIEAFDLWCRRTNRVAMPATAETGADYLDERPLKGSRPPSLARCKASIAKIHQLLDLKDPTPAPLVKLRLQAVRREKGIAQKQARSLRFKGPVRDVERDEARGLNIRALRESCPNDLSGLRDRALLSTAYLSSRTVAAIAAWAGAAGITAGPLFRRVQVRRYKARVAVRGRPIDTISSRKTWDLRKTLSRPPAKARVQYGIGRLALHPGLIGPVFRSIIQRAFDQGALPDLTAEDMARLLKRISAPSTRIGLNQELFASGEELAGIMDALRWRSPRMPLAYNRNLAAEQGAAGRLMTKFGRGRERIKPVARTSATGVIILSGVHR